MDKQDDVTKSFKIEEFNKEEEENGKQLERARQREKK